MVKGFSSLRKALGSAHSTWRRAGRALGGGRVEKGGKRKGRKEGIGVFQQTITKLIFCDLHRMLSKKKTSN